jgi:hypothetical protein
MFGVGDRTRLRKGTTAETQRLCVIQIMKGGFQRLLIGLTFLLSTGFNSNDTWKALNNRTWRSDIFAGSEIIFYETANGLRKAILQIHGSGVSLAGASIFDVVTDSEGSILKDGLDLMRRDNTVLEPIRLVLTSDSVLTLDNKVYKKKCDCLIAFNWQSRIGQTDSLDIERLKSISIGKKSTYDRDCFKN